MSFSRYASIENCCSSSESSSLAHSDRPLDGWVYRKLQSQSNTLDARLANQKLTSQLAIVQELPACAHERHYRGRIVICRKLGRCRPSFWHTSRTRCHSCHGLITANRYLVEHDAISRTIDCYIAGARAGDGDLMRPAFHPSATISGYCQGVEYTGSVEHVFQWINENGPAPNITPASPASRSSRVSPSYI